LWLGRKKRSFLEEEHRQIDVEVGWEFKVSFWFLWCWWGFLIPAAVAPILQGRGKAGKGREGQSRIAPSRVKALFSSSLIIIVHTLSIAFEGRKSFGTASNSAESMNE
jgi:hypothetical protein